MCDTGAGARQYEKAGGRKLITRISTPLFFVTAVLLACTGNGSADQEAPPASGLPQSLSARKPTRAPTLRNREEVLRYRDEAARLLLPPGDSITVRVYARIDAEGIAHQPEVKDTLPDERIKGAAISVVQLMRFNPATTDGQATSVLITIPVRFVHP